MEFGNKIVPNSKYLLRWLPCFCSSRLTFHGFIYLFRTSSPDRRCPVLCENIEFELVKFYMVVKFSVFFFNLSHYFLYLFFPKYLLPLPLRDTIPSSICEGQLVSINRGPSKKSLTYKKTSTIGSLSILAVFCARK